MKWAMTHPNGYPNSNASAKDKKMNKRILTLIVLLSLAEGNAQAGLPVFDGSYFAQAVLQVQGCVYLVLKMVV